MKHILALFLATVFTACGNSEAQDAPSDAAAQGPCMNDPNAKCWCSQKCGYRDKTDKDHPIYIENDRNGKFCYCKQWDLDYFEENCMEGQNIQQPPGAE